MSRHQSHITSAIQIITSLKLGEPLAFHLKKTFAANKKFGSTDRKTISNLCYQYFRLGQALPNSTTHEKIIAAHFLCNNTPNDFLAQQAPHFNEEVHLSVYEKCSLLNIKASQLFIWQQNLSEQLDADLYALSMLIQPHFYVRIRPNNVTNILKNLDEAGITYKKLSTTCIALPQGTQLQKFCSINTQAVVQDYNSQQVFNYIIENNINYATPPQVWDCCAASGGKSILLYDNLKGNMALLVSDIRTNIINNLKIRFKEAGIKNYQAFLADLATATNLPTKKKFDIIICDAPCSGSGTWGRTPEELYFFEHKSITQFANLQKKIASNALPFLQKGGLFFYITCSVFKQENEEVVNELAKTFSLTILHMQYLKGYGIQADTMFVAVLSF